MFPLALLRTGSLIPGSNPTPANIPSKKQEYNYPNYNILPEFANMF